MNATAVPQPRRGRRRRPLRATAILVTALALGVFSAFPFVWMVLTSLKPDGEIFTAEPVWWSDTPTFGRYADIAANFARPLLNSVIVAVAVTVLGIAVAVLAGYALARFDIPLRRYLLLLVLAVQMFPPVVLLIPLFIVMSNANLLNTYIGLIIIDLAATTPLAIWVLRGFMASIPRELEEAAMIDGSTRMGALRRVVLPVAAPGVAATAIFAFISTWNEFMFALTFMTDTSMRLLPVALTSFIGRAQTDWGGLMTASVLFTVPSILVFMAVHRRLVEGMAVGAVKG